MSGKSASAADSPHPRPRLRRTAIAFLAAIALAASPARAENGTPPPWHGVETAHFVVLGDVEPDQLQAIARQLERLRGVLSRLAPDEALDSAEPVRIFAFSDSAGLAPFLPAGRAEGTLAGYLVPHELGADAAFAQNASNDPQGTVLHQYVQYLLNLQIPWLPHWFRTGLSALFSNFESDASESRVGLPSRAHLYALRQLAEERPSYADIVERPGKFHPSLRLGAYESASWALAHYLLIGDGDRQERARDFAARVARGESSVTALREAFGPLVDDLQNRMQKYVEQEALGFLRIPVGTLPSIATQSWALAPHERDAALGELLLRVAPTRREDADRLFRSALESDSEFPAALAGIAQGLEAAGDHSAALAWYARAAADARADFIVHYRYGSALVQSLGSERPSDEAGRSTLGRARASLTKSVELNPGFAPAWARLGYAWGLETEPSPLEVEALERAVALQPGRPDVVFNLVLAWARRGDRLKVDEQIVALQRLGVEPARLARAREIGYQLDYRIANRMLKQRQLDDAIALLSRVAIESSDPDLRGRAGAQLDLAAKVVQHNLFVEAYQAVADALAAGDSARGFEALERLRTIAKPGIQTEIAGELQARLIGIEAAAQDGLAD